MTPEPEGIVVTPRLTIPLRELSFRASRSGGPGGQHVNTSSTRIELRWDAAGSPSLSEPQRRRVLERLASRLDGSGRLRLVSGARRSQLANREAVVERFRRVLREALRVEKPRKPTKPTRAARERRLSEKRRRSERKSQRRPPEEE